MKQNQIIEIGTRVEMFVDHYLIEHLDQVRLQFNQPEKKEIVLTFEQPWEGVHSFYASVFEDGQKIRLYYRGISTNDLSEGQVTCYAESEDGIHFTKPELGLIPFAGSTKNNIVLQGVIAHNFAPFYDHSPHASANEKYKALGGLRDLHNAANKRPVLYALCSADGIHWNLMQDGPVMADGAFDSHNIAFWDANIEAYRCYNRYFSSEHIRGVQSTTSKDFIHWGPQQKNEYDTSVPMEHFYTNATIPCPGAEHMYLSFPMRFVPNRKKMMEHHENGLSDAVFMTSRDGVHWDRTFMEAWLRPGLDQRNWTDRNSMVAHGCVETSSNELSFYLVENYRWDSIQLRRVAIRKHGFGSVHAGCQEGSFKTKQLRFSGNTLNLNYSTSVVGHVQVQVLDEFDQVIDGFSFGDMAPLYGDEIAHPVVWQSGKSLSELAGQVVRFEFRLKDADLFSIRTSTE